MSLNKDDFYLLNNGREIKIIEKIIVDGIEYFITNDVIEKNNYELYRYELETLVPINDKKEFVNVIKQLAKSDNYIDSSIVSLMEDILYETT